jgi:hypothetical protein
VHAPVQAVKVSLTRAAAIRAAYRCVLDTVKVRAPKEARHLVRKNQPLAGKFNSHAFDVALVNGSPFAAVNALSLGMTNRGQLQKDIDATAWISDDVKRYTPDLPLAVYIVRTNDDEELFDRTERTFNGLQTNVISNDNSLSAWADAQMTQKINLHP